MSDAYRTNQHTDVVIEGLPWYLIVKNLLKEGVSSMVSVIAMIYRSVTFWLLACTSVVSVGVAFTYDWHKLVLVWAILGNIIFFCCIRLAILLNKLM